MPVPIGTVLGSHEIIALLGVGGMGEVYRARDSKLKREVAIKILPEEFSRDADRVSRFQREAEVLASLNHSNIAAIYDLQEANGSRYLVLELVEGETLAERIARGAIPVEEALATAKSICEALTAAHDRGIIHRDLKPANIKLTPDGKVKVLDFGLAKAVQNAPAARTLSNSPTMLSGTMAGVIIGTAAYMSPEQAKGISADARSDIFSFGCVLYEMLTGTQTFQGETVSEILASVLIRDPDFASLPANVNPRLVELLKRSLQRSPQRRWHCAGDLGAELDAIAKEPFLKTDSPGAAASRRSLFGKLAVPFVVAAIIAGFGLGYWYYASNLVTAVARFSVLPPEKTSFVTGGRPGASAMISPDGRKFTFTAADAAGKYQLWVRGIDTLVAQPLHGTDDAEFPFWSPDSRYIAYFSQDKLLKIDTTGGPPQTLCSVSNARGGTWSKEGVIVFGAGGTNGNNQVLYRVSSAGGQAVEMTKTLPGGDAGQRFPSFLPDQRHVLLDIQGNGETAGIYVASIESGELRRILGTANNRTTSGAIYAAPGYLVFSREGTLLAQPFDAKRQQFSGEPLPLAEHVQTGLFNGGISFSVSDAGVLAYGSGFVQGGITGDIQLTWLDRRGNPSGTIGPVGTYRGIDLGPDGKTVAAHRHDTSQGGDVWLMDSSRGTNLRFTLDASRDNISPIWSTDGTSIIYGVEQAPGKWKLYQKPSTGAGMEQLLMEAQSSIIPQSWAPDGKTLVYQTSGGETGNDLWLLHLDGDRKASPLVTEKGNQLRGQISPDGKWLAYESNETGRYEIYIIPFPSPSGVKYQVSNNSGRAPRWRHDSRELFYVDELRGFWSVDIHSSGSKLDPGLPKSLFRSPFLFPSHPGGSYFAFAVSSDGQRFVVQAPASSTPVAENPGTFPIVVVLNWLQDLKQRTAVH